VRPATHGPSPARVERAAQRLAERAQASCDGRIQWTGQDREELRVLLSFVALVTTQAARYSRPT
jgi:hypothetical protein